MKAKGNLQRKLLAPIGCILEAYTEGSEHRAHARGRLTEIAPNTFSITPFYLREISGPDVHWLCPEPGAAIETTTPITNFDEAHSALAWWATQAFAKSRTL